MVSPGTGPLWVGAVNLSRVHLYCLECFYKTPDKLAATLSSVYLQFRYLKRMATSESRLALRITVLESANVQDLDDQGSSLVEYELETWLDAYSTHFLAEAKVVYESNLCLYHLLHGPVCQYCDGIFSST